MFHAMKVITPNDDQPVRCWHGEVKAVRVYVARGGWVNFHPGGNPPGENIRLRVRAGETLPCGVTHVFETGTTARELYAVWVDNQR